MKTVSLELAKQLKEAGYPQDSYFWYSQRNYSKQSPIDLRNKKGYADNWSAPTADEILYRLPGNIYTSKEGLGFRVQQGVTGDATSRYAHCIQNKSLADAAAKIWLYLKKNNL